MQYFLSFFRKHVKFPGGGGDIWNGMYKKEELCSSEIDAVVEWIVCVYGETLSMWNDWRSHTPKTKKTHQQKKKTHTQKRIKRCNPKNPKTYVFQLQNLLVNGSIFVGRPTSLRRIRTWTSWESFSSCSESSHWFFFRRVDSRSTIQISILPGSGMV